MISELIATLRTSNAYTVMMSQAAAERIGINTTDLHALNILAFSKHELGAGDLARMTGLTTAAITAVVDRLVRARLVERTFNPRDRRRVVVHLIGAEARKRVAPVFAPLLEAWHTELSRYSDKDLRLISDYQQRTLDVMREQLALLRAP